MSDEPESPPPVSALISELSSIRANEPAGAADMLHLLNKYFYQKSSNAPGYFSSFHAWWERNHRAVLNLEVDQTACHSVARHLIAARSRDDLIWRQTVDVAGVPLERVASIRFFTAVQDFKIDLSRGGRNPYKDALVDTKLFNARLLNSDPENVDHNLRYLQAQGAQGDKRRSWMLQQAKFLVQRYEGDAFRLLAAHMGDATAIRTELVSNTGMGFKEKKADMFLRDMADLGVWRYKSGVEQINVASDANAMRVALRTGIVRGRTPLLSSFLDVYCYQYALMDGITQIAWRAVWEEWGKISPSTQPPTPASLDYLIYKSIGKTYCSKTPKCKKGLGCPFDSHCPIVNRKLQPPKSISILGQTGWKSAESDDGGGLGLSS